MAEHCNGSGHVPGCNKGAGQVLSISPENSIPAAKEKAKDALNALRKERKTLTNAKTGRTVRVSKYLKGEILNAHNIKKSQDNLQQAGINKQEAMIIHLEAAAHIGELFEKAEEYEQKPVYHNDKMHKSKEASWHFFAPLAVQGHKGDFIADMSVLKFANAEGDELYAMSLELKRPPK